MKTLQKGFISPLLFALIAVLLIGGAYVYMQKSQTNQSVVSNLIQATSTNETADWLPFKSNFFALSFKIPPGFEAKEDQNRIRVAKPPYLNIEETPKEMGAYDAFFRLTRYDSNNTRENLLILYRKRLKNIQESTVFVDKSSYIILTGDDGPRTEGDNYPNELDVVFFNDSWLEIIDRQINSWESLTNPIAIGKQILSTFKFNP